MEMIWPERSSADFKTLTLQRFRFDVPSAEVEEIREIIDRCKCVDVFGAEHPLPSSQASSEQFFRTGKVSLLLQFQALGFKGGEIDQGLRRRRRSRTWR